MAENNINDPDRRNYDIIWNGLGDVWNNWNTDILYKRCTSQ